MGFIRRITGKTAADAAQEAANISADGYQEASALLDPFKNIGEQGLNLAGFLTDPNQQMDYLQNNPLFQMSLDNANNQTMRMAAASGRLSSGDTLQSLSNNVMLAGMPLIQNQQQQIGNLLNFGQATAANQGNLRVGQAAQLAGGIVNAENARAQGYQNILDIKSRIGSDLISGLTGGFSDPALKDNVKKVGEQNGYNIYTWNWNDKAEHLGLKGEGMGVMADEVKLIKPEAVTLDRGYLKVDYSQLEVAL